MSTAVADKAVRQTPGRWPYSGLLADHNRNRNRDRDRDRDCDIDCDRREMRGDVALSLPFAMAN